MTLIKLILTLQLVSANCLLFAQTNWAGVFLTSDDASELQGKQKYLWVGKKSKITPSDYIGNFINAWTDNGRIDSGYFYTLKKRNATSGTNIREDSISVFEKYWTIEPKKAGRVNIYSTQYYWTGSKYDTFTTKNSYIAIHPPKFKLKVQTDNYKTDTVIRFVLINLATKKKASARYQVGRMFEPTLHNSKDSLICKLGYFYGLKVGSKNDFSECLYKHIRDLQKKGYKIKISLLVRDVQTNLLIPAETFIYVIK